MIRTLLIALVLANVLLFGWNRGWFSAWVPSDREPHRITAQRHADRLRPVPLPRPETFDADRPGRSRPAPAAGSQAPAAGSPTPAASPGTVPDTRSRAASSAPASTGTPATGPPATGTPPTGTSADAGSPNAAPPGGAPAAVVADRAGSPVLANCRSFPAIDEDRALRLREALEATGARVDAQRIEQGASYLVYLPPAASLADAQRRLAELRRIGRDDAFLMQEGPYRLGISLGVFRAESAARVMVARLAEAGHPDALVAPRAPIQVRLRLEARWADPSAAAVAAMLGAQFDAPARDCG